MRTPPRAIVFPRPLQHVQVPAVRREDTGILVPWGAVLPRPPQYLQMPAVSGGQTDVIELPHVQVPAPEVVQQVEYESITCKQLNTYTVKRLSFPGVGALVQPDSKFRAASSRPCGAFSLRAFLLHYFPSSWVQCVNLHRLTLYTKCFTLSWNIGHPFVCSHFTIARS